MVSRLGYLAPFEQDLDGSRFVRGVLGFDLARHHPHPPGYPVYVGLATALLRRLAAGAVANGITRFAAEFFADNLDVTDLLEESDAPFRNLAEDAGVVSVELALPEQLEPE